MKIWRPSAILHRWAITHHSRREGTKAGPTPIISFTFDDCPRSAFQTGGEILIRHGVQGTFYIALGIMGTRTVVGEMFAPIDVERAISAGHELGSHTYDHCNARAVSTETYRDSLIRNEDALENISSGAKFQTFSYPFGSVTSGVKTIVGHRYSSARSTITGINGPSFDLNLLRSHRLYSCRHSPAQIERIIDRCCDVGGWLIFYTHDVAPEPSRFGCSPDDFERAVSYACKSGAMVAPITRAIEAISNKA